MSTPQAITVQYQFTSLLLSQTQSRKTTKGGRHKRCGGNCADSIESRSRYLGSEQQRRNSASFRPPNENLRRSSGCL